MFRAVFRWSSLPDATLVLPCLTRGKGDPHDSEASLVCKWLRRRIRPSVGRFFFRISLNPSPISRAKHPRPVRHKCTMPHAHQGVCLAGVSLSNRSVTGPRTGFCGHAASRWPSPAGGPSLVLRWFALRATPERPSPCGRAVRAFVPVRRRPHPSNPRAPSRAPEGARGFRGARSTAAQEAAVAPGMTAQRQLRVRDEVCLAMCARITPPDRHNTLRSGGVVRVQGCSSSGGGAGGVRRA